MKIITKKKAKKISYELAQEIKRTFKRFGNPLKEKSIIEIEKKIYNILS